MKERIQEVRKKLNEEKRVVLDRGDSVSIQVTQLNNNVSGTIRNIDEENQTIEIDSDMGRGTIDFG
jgi:hypothetical protein